MAVSRDLCAARSARKATHALALKPTSMAARRVAPACTAASAWLYHVLQVLCGPWVVLAWCGRQPPKL